VAAAILGEARDFDVVPYFWSDLADCCKLEYVGPAARHDREVVRGSLADGRFTIFYLDGGRVAAALTAGRPRDLMEARRLLASGTDLGERAGELADVDADLAAL
jgi:3-phenylpropionate/trans-cinnamate dioxygenase ferredoxin reductase subunit